MKSANEHKSFSAAGRRRKGRTSFEVEDSSAKDSEEGSDGDFKSGTRKGSYSRKNNGGRPTISTSNIGRNSEVRTSTRSVRKVSYAESEESEELDEGKKKKSQKVAVAVIS